MPGRHDPQRKKLARSFTWWHPPFQTMSLGCACILEAKAVPPPPPKLTPAYAKQYATFQEKNRTTPGLNFVTNVANCIPAPSIHAIDDIATGR